MVRGSNPLRGTILMKEYYFENNREIDPNRLKTEFIPAEEYKKIHAQTIRACHDVFIEYNGGILLVFRKMFPAKDIIWMIGGGIARGMKIEESLKKKAKEECNLEINDIKELGSARTVFETDPYGHGKGTDTLNIVYFAKGQGELKLNELHYRPEIITPEKYTEELKKLLHPYVKDWLDLAMPLIGK